MGGLCEERSKKGEEEEKCREKANNRELLEKTYLANGQMTGLSPHPYKMETRGRPRMWAATPFTGYEANIDWKNFN